MRRLNVDLQKVCDSFAIGPPLGTPQPVTGGLLHRMWRVETDQGVFALKVLNPEIMSRPDAKTNYRVSESIAYQAYMKGIHAVPAKTVGSTPWIESNGEYVMVFDWVDGITLLPENCTDEHGKRIGEVLAKIHSAHIVIDGLEPPTLSTVSEDAWKRHIDRAGQEVGCWGLSCETILHDVIRWSRLYQDAAVNLPPEFVISHRDLDAKNVIWNHEGIPYLIDWESAGYIHLTVELVDGALNWGRDHGGTVNKSRFQAIIESYLRAGGTLYGKALDAIYCSFGGRLEWIEYNMRRSVDSDDFDADDRELGCREVIHGLEEMRQLSQRAADFANWVDEVSGHIR